MRRKTGAVAVGGALGTALPAHRATWRPMDVHHFIALWSASGASERANKDSYLKDLADVLGAPHDELDHAVSDASGWAHDLDVDVAPSNWPATHSDRVTAVRETLQGEARGVEQVAKRFKGARRADVEAILESLAALGIAVAFDTNAGRRWVRTKAAA